MGKCKFLFFSGHTTLMFSIILKFRFCLFKTFLYKSHFIKILFTILFAFKIERLKYMKTLNT